MNRDDPRLRPGVLVRAEMVRSDSHDGEEVIGYVMNPDTKVPGYGPEGWPMGYNWGLLAKQSMIDSREQFWSKQVQGPMTQKDFSQVFKLPVGALWLFCCYFDGMEYLGEGFAKPAKPKHRRGKRHRMRSGL